MVQGAFLLPLKHISCPEFILLVQSGMNDISTYPSRGRPHSLHGGWMFRERFLEFRKHLLKELVQSGMNDISTYPSRGRPHSLPSSTRLGGRHFPVAIPPTYPSRGRPHSLPSSTRLEVGTSRVAIPPTYPSRGRPHSLPSSTRLEVGTSRVAIPPAEKKKEAYKRCLVCYSHNKWKDTKYKCEHVTVCLVLYHVSRTTTSSKTTRI